ncbi:Cof-type HAD-IIB family hydrolase [Sebaldella sp. S0638]|uniref:Cof-type HAD-IIB family hydrolase n=1 Tax=Sebaldella sp. S0638 TaxID=2957809 RepID=UPI0020A1D2C5|nr:Cof-type HAD-IIB family hydrolase [Sebaldella sp. S0638]MCP1224943.1 Cof-type HAD-IIB family hydrolase [Sebaldella sp. S0638]
MIKAVFFDFDDTLVSKKDHTMRENTEKAIKLLEKSGIIPVIATGRPKYTINDYLERLSIKNAVFLNGHTVWHEEKVVYDKTIDEERARAMFDLAKRNDFSYGLLNNDGTYLNLHPEKMSDLDVVDKEYMPQELGERYIPGNCLWIFAGSRYDNILTDTAERNNMRILRWNEAGVDIISKTVSKQTGVKILLENLGIDFSEVVSIGDGDNDIELLQASKLGIAMGNGSDILKSYADMVTDSIDDDGVYKALVKLGLI